jgi:hypothetical protein
MVTGAYESGIGHVLYHLSHDQRIANDKPKDFGVIAASSFVHDSAVIEPRE